MNNAKPRSIESRLQRLESQSKFWKHASIALLLLIIGGITLGTTAPDNKSITAEKLTIVDKDNNDRIIFTCLENTPTAIFLNEDKKPLLAIAAGHDPTTSSDVAGITLLHNNNSPGIQLQVDKNGPAIMFFDSTSNERISIGARDGGSAIVLRDEDGEIRTFHLVDSDGPLIYFFDENGKVLRKWQ